MTRETKRGRHEKIDCGHDNLTATETAGIQRLVCDTCGHVSFNFLYDVFEQERTQLESHSAQPSAQSYT